MVVKKKLSASEILDILDNQWLNTGDIQKIMSIGVDKARLLKKEIQDYLKENNYYLPNDLIPTDEFIKYTHINIGYLKKISSRKGE